MYLSPKQIVDSELSLGLMHQGWVFVNTTKLVTLTVPFLTGGWDILAAVHSHQF